MVFIQETTYKKKKYGAFATNLDEFKSLRVKKYRWDKKSFS